MTYAIAAAGTGGHVFPALAVGEALVELGVDRRHVHFVGGDRLEAKVFPDAGFPFTAVEVRGLERRVTMRNLGVPLLVLRARRIIRDMFRTESIRAALGFGNYVTVPFGWAAGGADIPLLIHEQNAHAGLGNKMAQRWATAALVSFPETVGLERQELTGNPIRRSLAEFDRDALRSEAIAHFELDPALPTLGVFGGSLGAAAINRAVERLATSWAGGGLQILHIVGDRNLTEMTSRAAVGAVPWHVVGFEERMELFFAAIDLVVARSGGGVAEVTATGTPSILVPGGFGSGGHQPANATAVATAGAAVVVTEDNLGSLRTVVREIIADPVARKAMATAARAYARPEAAVTIANRLIGVGRG